jgi:hypothetical protein
LHAYAGIQSYGTEFVALDPRFRGDERQLEWAIPDRERLFHANSPASNQMRRGALFRDAFLCAKGQAF